MVFMHGVVAVLHEHSVELTELHGEGYASARTQTIYVLAAALPRRHIGCAAVAGQNLAFFKVNVDRMVPAGAAILECPELACARSRRRSDPAVIGGQHCSGIGPHAPWILVSWIAGISGAAAKLKRTLAC